MESNSVSAVIKDYIFTVDLSAVEDRLVNIDGWKRKYAKEACKQYRNYIFLRKKYGPEHELPPSVEMDDVWHAHVLHTRDYFDFCNTIFGEYLHHDPHMEGGKFSVADLQRKFDKETQTAYFKEFGHYIYCVRPITLKEIIYGVGRWLKSIPMLLIKKPAPQFS
ncbi:MAG: glycine-rich domain-containing protein [Gammaproteobacteria bacterium]